VGQGITNPAEPYFKDGGWGWDGTLWRKLPIVWGYSDRYAQRLVNVNAALGDNTVTGSTVPEGEVWVVTAVVAFNTVSAITRCELEVYDGADTYFFRRKQTVAKDEETAYQGQIVMKKDDRIRATFVGCVAGDDLHLRMLGYKMQVNA